MERIFSFALGNLWTWNKNNERNDILDYVRKLGVDNVELTAVPIESLKISEENRRWLKGLEYVSIHPFIKGVTGSDSLVKQFDLIYSIYDSVNAKQLIIHPGELPSKEILKMYDMKVSTENMSPKFHIADSKLNSLITEYDLGLCLDVSHAYRFSGNETKKLVEIYGSRISQIHFSGTYRNKNHQSLRIVTQRFMDSIEPIKKLNVPIVIEEDIKEQNLDKVKEEIKYIKNLF
jgi:sugar phosphate isomerase/epimerase